MSTIRKCLFVTGVVAVGIAFLLVYKSVIHHGQTGTCEKAGKGLDDKLAESLAALEKATTQVQQVFEHLKPSK